MDLSFLIPDVSPLEIVIRGTITYLFIFVLLRVMRRQSGVMSITDLLVIVLIADAAQNSMAGQYTSVGDGLLLVFTIVAWAYGLDWLGYHFRSIERFVHPPPLPIIRDGRMVRRAMRSELISEAELMTTLRTQGIEDVGQVKSAYVEGNGEISVVRRDGEQPQHKKESRGAG